MSEMEYVVFRSYWSPPPGIIKEEIVPHARRDPGYLGRENLEIVASGRDDSGPAGHAREPGCSGCRSALRPAEAGTSELPGPRQVHLSQRRQHLYARHARGAALLLDAGGLAPRLHLSRGRGAPRRVGALAQPRADARAAQP